MNCETLPLTSSEPVAGSGLSGKYWRTYSDFNTLERALLCGDLKEARGAFDRLKEDLPTIAAALSCHPSPNDNDRLRAIKDLGHCLVTGNLRGAVQASRRFQSSMQQSSPSLPVTHV